MDKVSLVQGHCGVSMYTLNLICCLKCAAEEADMRSVLSVYMHREESSANGDKLTVHADREWERRSFDLGNFFSWQYKLV